MLQPFTYGLQEMIGIICFGHWQTREMAGEGGWGCWGVALGA